MKQMSSLIDLVIYMIDWGIQQQGQYTDRQLGEMLSNFVDQIVGCPSPSR